MGHVKALEKTSCKYPVTRVEVKVKIDLVVLEIKRIFPNSAVQSIAVYTGNDESLCQLSQNILYAANYKIKIKEMALYVRKVQLSPAVRMGHVKALEKTSCKYPVRRVEVKVDTVPTRQHELRSGQYVFGTISLILIL
jgi:hypothetical protein